MGVVVVVDMSQMRVLSVSGVRRGVGCPRQTRLIYGGPERDVDKLGPGCPSTWYPPAMVSRSSHEENFCFRKSTYEIYFRGGPRRWRGPPLCCVEVKLSRRFLRGRGVMSCIGHSPQLPNPASSQNLGEARPDGDVEIGSRGAGAEW